MNKNTVSENMKLFSVARYLWAAEYIAQISEKATPYCLLKNLVDKSVIEFLKILRDNPRSQFSADSIREKLIKEINDGALIPDDTALQHQIDLLPKPAFIQMDAAEILHLETEALRLRHQDALGSLRQFKSSAQAVAAAEYLAKVATGLNGHFNWIPGGPDVESKKFYPKSKTITDAGVKKNHYVLWLTKPESSTPEPDKNSNMCCWEAVLFAAYKAGQIPKQGLIAIYERATSLAQAEYSAKLSDTDGSVAYFQAIKDIFGLEKAHPLVPKIGLMPGPGDLVFCNGLGHVVLCVGYNPTLSGLDAVEVMSLFNYPPEYDKHFSKMQLSSLNHFVEGGSLHFIPFPFSY